MESSNWGISLILLSYSVTVKGATLIFISGCGLAISSVQEGKSCSIYLVKLFEPVNVRAFHENPNSLYTELTFINP